MHICCVPCHRVLAEAVLSFPPALTEVTLGIGHGQRVILRSYQEEEAGEGMRPPPRGNSWGEARAQDLSSPCACPVDNANKAMVTETSIGEEDFQQLQAPEGIALTFCLKEFRVSSLALPAGLSTQHRLSLPASSIPGAPELCRVSKLVS